jgi:hypothetical protein
MQCQLAHRCVGLSTAFVNILKYLVFRRSRPPGGRTLARRVSASNIIKRKRQAEVARKTTPDRLAEAYLLGPICGLTLFLNLFFQGVMLPAPAKVLLLRC